MRILILSLLFTCFALNGFGQTNNSSKPDTILYNNGKILLAHVLDTSSDKIEIEKPNSSKHKKIEIDRSAVFSIRYGSTGKEVLVYVYDTLIGNDFTIAEARMFIAGEQDAQDGFHATGTTVGAFLLGTAAGMTGVSIFSFGPPLFYSGLMAYPRIKISHKSVKNLNNVKSDPYLYGYDSVGRRKRVIKSLFWGSIGLIVGFIVNLQVLSK
jgi:hypothetical protein